MKILFICHNLTGGGAERVCVDVANGLANLGHEVSILTNLKQQVTYQPLPDVKLIQTTSYKNPVTGRLNAFKQLHDILRNDKPDVVISILYMYATLAKLASKLTIDCPIIASDHNSFERPDYAPMRFRQKLDKFWRNYYLDGLTVLTEADKNFLTDRFKYVYVMPNPLCFKPIEQVPYKENIVLAVGRLDAWHVKGFDLLINAWNLVNLKYPAWKLKIVGAGSEKSKDYLQSLVSKNIHVEFVPYTAHIIEEYKKASIFVLSSRYEGFGLVLTEAMSQGCACVACDYKGRQAEIVTDGVDGLICPVDDVNKLRLQIERLINDESLRCQIQENALSSVSRFNIANIAKRWGEMLMEYVKCKHSN